MGQAYGFYSIFIMCTVINLDSRSVVLSAICTSSVCRFELDITLYNTMTYRDEYLIPRPVYLNGTQIQANVAGEIRNLSSNDVILADGFTRDVILINGQFPGPTIEVMEGSQVGVFQCIKPN
jgi:Multicopper oxidase